MWSQMALQLLSVMSDYIWKRGSMNGDAYSRLRTLQNDIYSRSWLIIKCLFVHLMLATPWVTVFA